MSSGFRHVGGYRDYANFMIVFPVWVTIWRKVSLSVRVNMNPTELKLNASFEDKRTFKVCSLCFVERSLLSAVSLNGVTLILPYFPNSKHVICLPLLPSENLNAWFRVLRDPRRLITLLPRHVFRLQLRTKLLAGYEVRLPIKFKRRLKTLKSLTATIPPPLKFVYLLVQKSRC